MANYDKPTPLTNLIKETSETAFVPDYQVTDAKALGVICSEYLQHEPNAVFDLVYELLTQINYDHLIGKIEELT